MESDELVALKIKGTLTDLALDVLNKEIQSRGITDAIQAEIAKQIEVDSRSTAHEPRPGHALGNRPLGTKWMRFWTNFSLPVGAVTGLAIATYSVIFHSHTTAVLMIFIALMLYSILQAVTAAGLRFRRLWGWNMNWVMIVSSLFIISIPIPQPLHAYEVRDLIAQFLVKLLIASLFWLWPNYIYWKKRKHLFS